MPIWATHIPSNKGKSARAAAFQPGDEKYTGVDVWLQNETFYSRVVAFPQVVAKSRVLESERHRKYLLHSERARALAIDLHSEGIDFLFGMLFRGSFRFADTLLQETLASSGQLPDSAFSMALHSRHSDKQDHGCDIARERACLEQVFAQMSDANTTWQSCHLFVMADRICTLQQVSEYVQTNASFCRVETAQHSKAGRSWRWEHGPFAGIGYYEDWILASRARQGFIGTRRSSSDLIKEIIEFDRRMEAVSKSTGDVPPLIQCKL